MCGPEIDFDTLEPLHPWDNSIAGVKLNRHHAFRSIMSISDLTKDVDVSAHGGMTSWEDLVYSILYGANTVQVLTTFMRYGFRRIPDMLRGLSDFMDKHGFATIEDMRGLILPKLTRFKPEQTYKFLNIYQQMKGVVVAGVDEDKCNGCGLCEEICPHDAIRVIDTVAAVDKGQCDGCNMCAMACTEKAIALQNLDLYWKLSEIPAKIPV